MYLCLLEKYICGRKCDRRPILTKLEMSGTIVVPFIFGDQREDVRSLEGQEKSVRRKEVTSVTLRIAIEGLRNISIDQS